MKLLIVAYEFPPSPSPQSLRWGYLAAEMSRLGHEVHVLAPDLSYGALDTPFDLGAVAVHRCYPGPIKRFISRRLKASATGAAGPNATDRAPADPRTRLNWKGKALALFERALSAAVFPDHRGLWNAWARRKLFSLLDALDPDVVIASHEPANTLRLGLAARERGFAWIADLGDPVLAPYTPARWRRKAFLLEGETYRRADAVVVTNEKTRAEMIERHGPDTAGKLAIVPQGCPDREPAQASRAVPEPGLELVYTGAFYPFRPAEPLLEAVAACEGVRLRIASALPPESAIGLAARHPDKIVLCGHLAHGDSLALQDQADVLVNIGNLLPAQVPGKLFEYLSSGRPILHLRSTERDAGADLVDSLRRGWVAWNRSDAVGPLLRELAARKRAGVLADGLDLSDETIAPYRWSALAARYLELVSRAREFHDGYSKRTET